MLIASVARRGLAASAALAVALLAGCASGPSDLEISDTAFLPSGRISVPIAGAGRKEAPSTAQNGHAIEMSYYGSQGSDKQDLEAGNDPILFNGVTFNAPVELRHEYKFRYGEAVYRWRHFFGSSRKFGMEALGGVGHGIFYVSTMGGGLAASHKYNSTGLVLGLGGIWKFRPDTSLQVRISGMGGGGKEEVNASRFDLHVVHTLARNIALRGGLSSWAVSVQRFGSDIDASFSGPAAALEISF